MPSSAPSVTKAELPQLLKAFRGPGFAEDPCFLLSPIPYCPSPCLTSQEFDEYFGRFNGLDEATLKKRVDDIFKRLDMNGFRDRRCDKLSTGMMQKTSIARTLVHDPPVMIFDEPTNGLDIMTARTITSFIRECRDHGKTVIFSTHIMSQVEKLCDTIGIIQSGKLLSEGTLAQLRDKYAERDLEEIFVKVVTPHYVASEAN